MERRRRTDGIAQPSAHSAANDGPDIVCLSHLRWRFVYQRPQHLLSRFARSHRVFFIEEPVFGAPQARLDLATPLPGVTTVAPQLPAGMGADAIIVEQKRLVDDLVAAHEIDRFVLWYYTPMAVPWTRNLHPLATVYDCMDELSAFAEAPALIRDHERELLDRADLVFTGGVSLYEAKRHLHARVHAFPSGVDVEHFGRARSPGDDPEDQRSIPHPRVGFYGVIDERLDRELLAEIAALRPEMQFVVVGPTVKVDEAALPRADNLHYLGVKEYAELPEYLRGWDVAMMPFARNEATRFISPTKTPEYLAAGRPVVSTSIRDVVRPYGDSGLVEIADDGPSFVASIDRALDRDLAPFLEEADRLVATLSWDRTWTRMRDLVADVVAKRAPASGAYHGVIDLAEATLSAKRNGLPSAGTNGDGNMAVTAHSREFDWLVAGAGFAGAVLAERLASQTGARVLVVDRRRHVAGNAYDHYDDDGLLVHRYGPHIFHTNAAHVFDYLSEFTRWRPYEHRVLASVDGQLVPIPINLDTINRLYGLSLDRFTLQEFFDTMREPVDHPRTSEDVVVSAVGRELYEKFFRNYTRKQWGLDPSELDASVTSRVPTRTNRDDRYFTDTYQAMPLHGYTRMFERMLSHPNIKVMLNTDYREIVDVVPFREMIYTGPIDEYFDYTHGKLPYRSLDFRFETHHVPVHQPAPVVNFPNEYAYTRVTEFKYLTGQVHPKTSVVYEYPKAGGDPYYPVPRPENAELYKRYKHLAQQTAGVHFVGRLATYKYYNMDQVVAQALAVFERLAGRPRDRSKEIADDPDGAIISSPGTVGWDRVHPQPRRGSLLRSAGS